MPMDKLLEAKILATIQGQCVGDAIGLLTEFMGKQEARKTYGRKPKMLLYSQKAKDFHRSRWADGDWTDDSDHMILILLSIIYNKGQIVLTDFASRIFRWYKTGFPELGDIGGMGVGATTSRVLENPKFKTHPQEAAYEVWDHNQRVLAPNGAVMRTSILGLHQWHDLDIVTQNALEISKCTHYDPRCQASCVAVSVAIALMLQQTAEEMKAEGSKRAHAIDESAIIKQAYERACQTLSTQEEREELWWYMSCTKLKALKLDEPGKIGFTYKCMGAGFWAFKQKDFRKALTKLILMGGDADTNGAVAGAMLACKLGTPAIPQPWLDGLVHKEWLMDYVNRFLKLQKEMTLPVEQRSSYDDLDLEVLGAADEDRIKKKCEASH